jgi:methylenetetrahydrofolate dehydrogenase (NADP+) / methenyltetrahydrofolate cyclohydrolase
MIRLDGKVLAAHRLPALRERANAFAAMYARKVGLAVVLVGDDPASAVYTRNKERAAADCGLHGELHRLPATATESEVLALVQLLVSRGDIDGILVQLPLPKGISEVRVLGAIAPEKDVDGFHAVNVGNLSLGRAALVPCTPRGCMRLLEHHAIEVAGRHAVIIGRSNIVGKPMAQLLLAANATVTVAHSRTANLAALVATADIVVAAVGKAEMVRAAWLKPGAVVLDVGINRVCAADGTTKLVGDVHTEECSQVASAISPVPGGVGPMTISCLLENTLDAAYLRAGAT